MPRTVWFLLLSFGLPLISGWTLSLTPNEERLQNRRSGDNFLVVCKVKDFDGAASDVKIEWYHDGKLIPRFGSIMTIERTYSNQLMINRPKTTDGGEYTCKAEILGKEQDVSAEISFVDPPTFVNIKDEQHPEEGTRAEIICEIEGTDQLEVFWQFNGVTLDETSQRGYEFSENNQILYIPHFTAKKDDGVYNCNAAQYSSFETLSINVTGYARPTITVFDVPNGNRGIEGHTIELKCGAVGKPKPTYKWFFEDDEVPIARSDKHNVDEGLLIVESLNSEDDGNYKCIASNIVGTSEQSFELSVFLKPKVDFKSDHVVKEGEDLDIICSYHGEGQISAKIVSGSREFLVNTKKESESKENKHDVQESEEATTTEAESSEKNDFLLDEVELKSSENSQLNKNEGESEDDEAKKWKRSAEDKENQKYLVRTEENKLILTIKQVLLEDAADYTCSVSNEAGTTNKVSQVGIIHPPALRHYSGPHIRSFDGNTVSIYCDVSAVPSPKWHWYKEGKEVEANGATIKIDSQASSSKLTLENFDNNYNYGVYTCRADNGVGQLEKQINVIRIVKPAAPVEMDCKKMMYPNFGKCSFDMDAYKDENSRPQSFEVLIAKLEEMESDYDWEKAEKISVRFENDTTLPNLAANTQYVIKARAVNEAGTSEYTNEISLETTDPWAPQAPSSVSMECSEYCVVSWGVPNDHGSKILKYQISIQEMKVEKPELEKTGVTIEEPEFISEVRSTEDTARSDETTRDTSELSSIEEENISDSRSEEIIPTAKLAEFSAEVLPTDLTTSVEKEELNNEIVAFGVPTILEVDGEEHQLQLTSIKPHSYYKISVSAINNVGQGEAAEIEHQTDESPTKYENENETFWIIVAISVAAILLLFLVDLGCFLSNRCGLISCICLNLCGRSSGTKQGDLEAGRGGPESNRLLESSGAR